MRLQQRKHVLAAKGDFVLRGDAAADERQHLHARLVLRHQVEHVDLHVEGRVEAARLGGLRERALTAEIVLHEVAERRGRSPGILDDGRQFLDRHREAHRLDAALVRFVGNVGGFRFQRIDAKHQHVDAAIHQRAFGALLALLRGLAAHRHQFTAPFENGFHDLPAAAPPRLVERAVGQRQADLHLLSARGGRHFVGGRGLHQPAECRRAQRGSRRGQQRAPAGTAEFQRFGRRSLEPLLIHRDRHVLSLSVSPCFGA